MKDLRLTRLILALSITDTEYLKQQLKLNSNRFYLLLFTAIEQLSNIELTRDEIYLRVYKKKWNAKLDATFRTDLSRLADFIEDTLIQQRLLKRIKEDIHFYEEEKLNLYTDLKLDKESEVQYLFIINDNSIYPEHKNTMSKNFADTIVRNNMLLKVKLNLIDKIQKDFNKQSFVISEIQQSNEWLLKCIFNYYYKQINGIFFEEIDITKLLLLADSFNDTEAKFNILNGISYLKIDSKSNDINITVYENAVELASILVQKNPNYFHKQLKALHLIGTRYSILGNFEKGNIYFENAIQILPKNQFKNYKTIILNYATNCSKLKQFDKSIQLIQLLDDEASTDAKLKVECCIRSLSCYLFMDNAKAIHQLVISQDYSTIQPHEKIYFRLCQCLAFLMENEYDLANSEINNLMRSKLLNEIDADFLPATELINFMITAIFRNGNFKFSVTQSKQFEALKIKIGINQFPYLQHYSPYLWLLQKLQP